MYSGARKISVESGIGADFSLFLWVQVPSIPLTLFVAFHSSFYAPFLSPNGPFLQWDICGVESFLLTHWSPGGSATETYFQFKIAPLSDDGSSLEFTLKLELTRFTVENVRESK